MTHKKLKLLAMKKSKYYSAYSFEKEQAFFDFFRGFLANVGIWAEEAESFARPYNEKKKEHEWKKEDEIEEYKDRHFSFSNEDYSVDVVFGEKKVFLFVFSIEDKQEMIAELINEHAG